MVFLIGGNQLIGAMEQNLGSVSNFDCDGAIFAFGEQVSVVGEQVRGPASNFGSQRASLR